MYSTAYWNEIANREEQNKQGFSKTLQNPEVDQ
jgi:hypothetical protein